MHTCAYNEGGGLNFCPFGVTAMKHSKHYKQIRFAQNIYLEHSLKSFCTKTNKRGVLI